MENTKRHVPAAEVAVSRTLPLREQIYGVKELGLANKFLNLANRVVFYRPLVLRKGSDGRYHARVAFILPDGMLYLCANDGTPRRQDNLCLVRSAVLEGAHDIALLMDTPLVLRFQVVPELIHSMPSVRTFLNTVRHFSPRMETVKGVSGGLASLDLDLKKPEGFIVPDRIPALILPPGGHFKEPNEYSRANNTAGGVFVNEAANRVVDASSSSPQKEEGSAGGLRHSVSAYGILAGTSRIRPAAVDELPADSIAEEQNDSAGKASTESRTSAAEELRIMEEAALGKKILSEQWAQANSGGKPQKVLEKRTNDDFSERVQPDFKGEGTAPRIMPTLSNEKFGREGKPTGNKTNEGVLKVRGAGAMTFSELQRSTNNATGAPNAANGANEEMEIGQQNQNSPFENYLDPRLAAAREVAAFATEAEIDTVLAAAGMDETERHNTKNKESSLRQEKAAFELTEIKEKGKALNGVDTSFSAECTPVDNGLPLLGNPMAFTPSTTIPALPNQSAMERYLPEGSDEAIERLAQTLKAVQFQHQRLARSQTNDGKEAEQTTKKLTNSIDAVLLELAVSAKTSEIVADDAENDDLFEDSEADAAEPAITSQIVFFSPDNLNSPWMKLVDATKIHPSNQPSPAAEVAQLELSDAIQCVLYMHNMFRSAHGVAPLQWSCSCAQSALKAAEKIESGETLDESQLGNSFFSQEASHLTFSASSMGNESMSSTHAEEAPATLQEQFENFVEEALDNWYNECKKSQPYDYLASDPLPATRHFTQLIWASTTHVGVAVKNGHLVAHYSPIGNTRGKFLENVKPQNQIDLTSHPPKMSTVLPPVECRDNLALMAFYFCDHMELLQPIPRSLLQASPEFRPTPGVTNEHETLSATGKYTPIWGLPPTGKGPLVLLTVDPNGNVTLRDKQGKTALFSFNVKTAIAFHAHSHSHFALFIQRGPSDVCTIEGIFALPGGHNTMNLFVRMLRHFAALLPGAPDQQHLSVALWYDVSNNLMGDSPAVPKQPSKAEIERKKELKKREHLCALADAARILAAALRAENNQLAWEYQSLQQALAFAEQQREKAASSLSLRQAQIARKLEEGEAETNVIGWWLGDANVWWRELNLASLVCEICNIQRARISYQQKRGGQQRFQSK